MLPWHCVVALHARHTDKLSRPGMWLVAQSTRQRSRRRTFLNGDLWWPEDHLSLAVFSQEKGFSFFTKQGNDELLL